MDSIQQEPVSDEVEDTEIDPSDTAAEMGEVSTDEGDASPEQTEQEQRVEFDEAQQAKVNALIGAKVAKVHEAQREAEELRKRVAEMEANQPKPVQPVIPDVPDPDDYYGDPEGYRAKIAIRDKAIAESVEFGAKQRVLQEQAAQQAQRQQAEKFEAQQKAVQGYAEKAQSFGIDPLKMQQDAATVSQFLASPELDDFVVSDPQGPLVTSFLANNMLELDKVKSMTPTQAAVYIATEIKPKLASAKTTTNAPKPPDIVDGGGAPEKSHPALKGAVFK